MHPAQAVRQNEMPFVRDIDVVPSNTILDRGPDPPTGTGDLGWKPPVRSDAAYRQIAMALAVVRQLRLC